MPSSLTASAAAGLLVLCTSALSQTVNFSIDAAVQHPISRFIYGTNAPDWAGSSKYLTLGRLGGNRWTAYNWENNASNAGSDWYNQNDDFLGGGDIAGEAVRARVAGNKNAGAASIVTIPMAGYAAADKLGNGDVNQTPDYIHTRFKVSMPSKGAAFTYPPNLSDGNVYQDEFVAWMEKTFPRATLGSDKQIFYCLDNEPDLWAYTHSRIHSDKTTYAELFTRSVHWAAALKQVAPAAKVLAPASYGWYGFVRLQDAPDANNRDFLTYYLAQMKAAEASHGKRLVDVLDLHWYPEATGGGVRITGEDTSSVVVNARVQAPRSLWDPSYTETSWITKDWLNGPIRLVPYIQERIKANYPGTGIAFTEYYYGGGAHISGAIAQADVLGVFGRENVFAACLWPLTSDQRFVNAGFDCFRNYDGRGSKFGDLSLSAITSDNSATSVYASADSSHPGRMVVVAINRSNKLLISKWTMSNFGHYKSLRAFRLEGTTAKVLFQGATTRTPPTGTGPDTFAASLYPMSVSVFEFSYSR